MFIRSASSSNVTIFGHFRFWPEKLVGDTRLTTAEKMVIRLEYLTRDRLSIAQLAFVIILKPPARWVGYLLTEIRYVRSQFIIHIS